VYVREEGGVSDLLVSNAHIESRHYPGNWWGKGEPVHLSAVRQWPDRPLGRIRNVRFAHLSARSGTGVFAHGCGESPIEGLCMDTVRLELTADAPTRMRDVSPVHDGIAATWEAPAAPFDLRHVQGARLTNIDLVWPRPPHPFTDEALTTSDCTDLVVDACRETRPAR
jgi:hypothetical protein